MISGQAKSSKLLYPKRYMLPSDFNGNEGGDDDGDVGGDAETVDKKPEVTPVGDIAPVDIVGVDGMGGAIGSTIIFPLDPRDVARLSSCVEI